MFRPKMRIVKTPRGIYQIEEMIFPFIWVTGNQTFPFPAFDNLEDARKWVIEYQTPSTVVEVF